MPTSVALGAHFEAFIKEQIAGGRYNNASEVVRDGLRMLEDRQQTREAKLAALRADIQAGLDSGEPIYIDDAFAQVRRSLVTATKAAG